MTGVSATREPPQDLHLPSDRGRPKSGRARRRSSGALATQAFRRPVTERDVQRLMRFYDDGRKEGDFEHGVGSGDRGDAGQPAVPVPPRERPSRGATAGKRYASTDLDLASRLSFFLWGTAPDAELMTVASQGR